MTGLLLLLSCAARPALPVDGPAFDAVVVPGCPVAEGGRLSRCLWRRTTWAAWLYGQGVTRHLIPSGNAVYNRYVEAEAIAAGLVALGVPPEALVLEKQALHTDENVAYAMRLADDRGWARLAVASDMGQARGGCTMLRVWGHPECVPLGIDEAWVARRLAEPLPDVVVTRSPRPSG